MTAERPALARGRQDLAAATTLLEAGFPNQALSRAATGALRAAEAALLAVDTAPTTNSGVVAAFTRRVVVQGGLDPGHGRALRALFEDRHDVEDALAEAPEEEALRGIRQAEALVEAIAQWIADLAAPPAERPATRSA
jgi:uncharacterized protein (UPF0332 family)